MWTQSWSFAAIFVLALGFAFAPVLGSGAGTVCNYLFKVGFAPVLVGARIKVVTCMVGPWFISPIVATFPDGLEFHVGLAG